MKFGKIQLQVILTAILGAIIIIVFFKFDISMIKGFIVAHPELTLPILFAIFFIASYTLIPITPLTILTVSLLDFWEAYSLIVVAAILGAIGPYFLAARIGKKIIHRELSNTNIQFEKLDRFLAKHGIIAVIVARLLPILPYSVWNYIFGLSSINFFQYIIGTIIGMACIEFIYIYVITGFISLSVTNILISLVIILIVIYFIRDIKKKFEIDE